jgi:hypothetical protein
MAEIEEDRWPSAHRGASVLRFPQATNPKP